jgi:hypothetical protein
MKAILAILVIVALTGCISVYDANPFAHPNVDRVRSIALTSGSRTFIISDSNVVHQLTQLITDGKRYEGLLPGIGYLSTQKYRDRNNNVLAEASILTWHNTVTINRPKNCEQSRFIIISEPYCRMIYDLMLKNCPEEIERKRKAYQEAGWNLERLLFEGDAKIQ